MDGRSHKMSARARGIGTFESCLTQADLVLTSNFGFKTYFFSSFICIPYFYLSREWTEIDRNRRKRKSDLRTIHHNDLHVACSGPTGPSVKCRWARAAGLHSNESYARTQKANGRWILSQD